MNSQMSMKALRICTERAGLVKPSYKEAIAWRDASAVNALAVVVEAFKLDGCPFTEDQFRKDYDDAVAKDAAVEHEHRASAPPIPPLHPPTKAEK